MKKILLTILILAVALGAGIYFKDNAINLFYKFTRGIETFKKTEIGNIISEISKEVLTPAPLNVGGAFKDVNLTKEKIISETNLQRQKNGLPALTENQKLNDAALAKANDMFKNQYFEHVSPSGKDPGTLVKEYGYDYILTGENLILGNFSDEKDVVQKWMDSLGHRENILNNRYTEMGGAVIKGTYQGQTVWIGVQEFGLPSSACPEPSAALKNQIESYKNQLDIISNQIEAVRAQINSVSRKSFEYNSLVKSYNELIDQYQQSADATKKLVADYNNQVSAFNLCIQSK